MHRRGTQLSNLRKAMDEQRLKEIIRASELKISDMEQQVFLLKMKIEKEKQILKKYHGLKSGNYVAIEERF
jgi:hypothetical protein